MVDGNGQEIGDAAHIGNKNPFRYRSYYFDTETGLYYLKSRYYDPEICRFITIDDISYIDITQEYINGINLYAYCFNNPINTDDENGNLPRWLKWLFVGVIAIAAVAFIATGIGLALSAAAATSAIISLSSSVLISVGTTVLFEAGSNFIEQGKSVDWNFNKINPDNILSAGISGAAIGLVTGVISWGIGYIGGFLGQQLGVILGTKSFLGYPISKVVNPNTLAALGKVVGGISGALLGGIGADAAINKLLGKQNNFISSFNDNLIGELFGRFLDFIRSI